MEKITIKDSYKEIQSIKGERNPILLAQRIIDERFDEELNKRSIKSKIEITGVKWVKNVRYEHRDWAAAFSDKGMSVIDLDTMKLVKTVWVDSNIIAFKHFVYYFKYNKLTRLCLYSLQEKEIANYSLEGKSEEIMFLNMIG